MDKNKIMKNINNIFKDVLENNNLVIDDESTSENVEDWDSLNHILLVVNIEKLFNINFTAQEIQSYSDVGEMRDAIFEKIKN